MSPTLALANGVTLPVNKASRANGTDGRGVWVGAVVATNVAVGSGFTSLASGVLEGAGAWVFSGRGVCGAFVFSRETAGRLICGMSERIPSRTPAATNAPRTEKAVCARTLFCWRMR
jgi:hypothetical protein